jgi:hypothetical protein
LFGILSMGFEGDFRDVHRSSWMTNPGACGVDVTMADHYYGSIDVAKCNYFYTFAVGHNDANAASVDLERQIHQDLSVLRLKGNFQGGMPKDGTSGVALPGRNVYRQEEDTLLMLDPKSFVEPIEVYDKYVGDKVKKMAWYKFAVETFKWATHIVCMDLDTYPYADLVVRDMADPMHSAVADKSMMPAGWSEAGNGMYYGAACGGKWGMRQGALVGISRSFLLCMFSVPRLKNTFDHELGAPGGDAYVRSWVKTASKSEHTEYEKGICADPWHVGPASCSYGDAWQHPV